MSRPLIVSLSGGKDSTALLLMLLERKEPVHSAVFYDTGWEFPQMHGHLSALAADIAPVPLVMLKPRIPFVEWMLTRVQRIRKGPRKGEIRYVGAGWPTRRWCTRIKVTAIDQYAKTVPGAIQCIGFAKGEEHRAKSKNMAGKGNFRFPLIEWGVDEPLALSYCLEKKYNWGGLYDVFHRVSCFCCPHQRLESLRKVRWRFPNLWSQMLYWDAAIAKNRPAVFQRKKSLSLHDLDARFFEEDRKLWLPGLSNIWMEAA